jgi:hypothetical protein
MTPSNDSLASCCCEKTPGGFVSPRCPHHGAHEYHGANVTPDPLAKAIEYLGAVEVAPGRYAFRHTFEDEGCFRVAPSDVLAAFGEILTPEGVIPSQRDGCDYYADLLMDSVRMPPWWSPEQRFRKCEDAPNGCGRYCITADLTTGEEVLA